MSANLEDKLQREIESLGYRVSRYVYPPGTIFSVHVHPVDKIDAVVSGVFKIVLEGKDIILRAGDMIHVPKGVRHSAEVIGNESVISLDGVKA